jgi:hypothetical protein
MNRIVGLFISHRTKNCNSLLWYLADKKPSETGYKSGCAQDDRENENPDVSWLARAIPACFDISQAPPYTFQSPPQSFSQVIGIRCLRQCNFYLN